MVTNIIQQNGNSLVITSKTIDWLVNNTSVRLFDPIRFEGYQRQIDEKHCQKIVNYLKDSCFLPSAIICSCAAFTDTAHLFIVDGQHRVRAFKMLEHTIPERYAAIKDVEIPVVVLVNVPMEVEINTFITINKTSKKVDTSLAYVLKNKISKGDADMAMPRAEYIAVEVAVRLNEEGIDSSWTNKILYEGSVKQSNCYISLNAFVRATRVLVNTLNQIGYVNLQWDNNTKEGEVEKNTDKVTSLIYKIWQAVYQRWPELKDVSFEEKQVLQGSIGYTAIMKTLVRMIKKEGVSAVDVEQFMSKTIMSFGVSYEQWTKKGSFSSYSSEAGYKIVSEALEKSIRN